MSMLKYIITALIVTITVNNANADALHRNPSQPGNALNMKAFGNTSIPIGAYEYCNRYQERCQVSDTTPILNLTKEVWTRIVDVNYSVNSEVIPLTDMENFGELERWELPGEAGDCEDYVLEKRRKLEQIGVPSGTMRATVVYDADGGGHAVLTVVTDQGDFILDNNNNQVLRWQDAELTYLKRQLPGDLTKWESLQSS